MALRGRIHSTESCGTLDGPGIRYIVFMQGCLMRCKYCHNRDTWDLSGGEEVTVDQLMPEILSYRHFMKSSGGGVTASGGEAVLQREFVGQLFKACKEEGIHTTLDTNGFVKQYDEDLNELLSYTDLVMLDLKQMDDKAHVELTKTPNRYSLDFARYLAVHDKPMWIRLVVVPGHTDSVENADKMGRFIAKELGNKVEKVELLPYHTMGAHKWEHFGGDYELIDVKSPTAASMEQLKNVIASHGVNVVLG